jgi:N-acetylmuramoyl-L-alanine amidase
MMKKFYFLLLLFLILTTTILTFFSQAQASTYSNFVYTVQLGDTLWLLSQRFNTTVAAIKAASGCQSDMLMIGQKLNIPIKSDAQSTYVVKQGDSLWKISQNYGVTIAELKNANSLISDYLYIGQVLLVPQRKSTDRELALSKSQIDLLARLVNAEAGGESYEGQVAVAAVVINRVKDPRFPNTLEEVIYEPWAFEPVMNGWIDIPATQTAVNATADALKGWDPVEGALFFYNPALTSHPWMLSRPVIKRIGNHVFAR